MACRLGSFLGCVCYMLEKVDIRSRPYVSRQARRVQVAQGHVFVVEPGTQRHGDGVPRAADSVRPYRTVSVRFCADILPLMASWSARDTPSGCTKQQRGAPISQQVTDTRPLQRGLPLA